MFDERFYTDERNILQHQIWLSVIRFMLYRFGCSSCCELKAHFQYGLNEF